MIMKNSAVMRQSRWSQGL
uniref:Uncharacterized protein n=1 Tax=Rhizophora mucronata TaxID=61149 RepID=A0A2P2NDA4_RHIMU